MEKLACGWKANVILLDNALILRLRLTPTVKSFLNTALRMAIPALRLLVAQKLLLKSHAKSVLMAYAPGNQLREPNPLSVNCFRNAKILAVHQPMCAKSTIRAVSQMDLIALRKQTASVIKRNWHAIRAELMVFAFTKKINVD